MWVFAFTSSTAVLGARYTYGVIVSKSDICFDESKEKEYVISCLVSKSRLLFGSEVATSRTFLYSACRSSIR